VPGLADRPGHSHAPDQPDASEMPAQLRTASPQPAPDRADEATPVDRPRPGDERVPWSRADLQQRLERLPPGHPSSPDHSRDEPEREPDTAKRSYWTELPRFFQAWTDHLRRWPAERATITVDRSRDPEGSWRGDGNQYLSPEENARANDEIAAVQRKEEVLTKQMGQAERGNPCGGWLAGLEFSIKGQDRLKEKTAELLEASAGATTPQQIVRDLPDAIRYTFCFEPNKYADGYWDIKQRLETNEFRMTYSKNHWRDDAEYKGINTRWVTADGQRFEVQFHTPEGFHAKQQVTHHAYERSRNPLTSNEERGELAAFQREVCSWITVPEGAQDIPDHRTKGR
jgi:hypothetical protein